MTNMGEEHGSGEQPWPTRPGTGVGPEQWLENDPLQSFGSTIEQALQRLTIELAGLRAERDGLRLELEGIRTQLELTQQQLADRDRFASTVRELGQIVQQLSAPTRWGGDPVAAAAAQALVHPPAPVPYPPAPAPAPIQPPAPAPPTANPYAPPAPYAPPVTEPVAWAPPVAPAAPVPPPAPYVPPAPEPVAYVPPGPQPEFAPPAPEPVAYVPPAPPQPEPVAYVPPAPPQPEPVAYVPPAPAPAPQPEPVAYVPPTPEPPAPEPVAYVPPAPEPEPPVPPAPDPTAFSFTSAPADQGASRTVVATAEESFFSGPGVWIGEPPKADERRNAFKIWATRVGTVAASLIVAMVFIVSIGPKFLPYQMFFVRSGSMHPTFDTGDMVVLTKVDASDLKKGDIITFDRPDRPGTLVTHRIVDITTNDQGRSFQTKGDFNDTADPWSVPATGTGWKYKAHIPKLGFLFGYLGTPQARLALLAIPAVLLGLLSIIDIWKPQPKQRGRG